MSEQLAISRSNDQLLITLDRWESGQISVWNVEFLGEGVRNRVSFTSGRLIDDVFVPGLARMMRELLSGLDRHTRIFSDAEFELTLPGVSLHGLRLMIAQAQDNFDRILLRFRVVEGQGTGLFRDGRIGDQSAVKTADRLAVQALADIVLPVCDLAESLRSLDTEEVSREAVAEMLEDRIADLAERSGEMRLYMHLLMRYVEAGQERREALEIEDAVASLLTGLGANATPSRP